jgi:uncharacterized membrane protein
MAEGTPPSGAVERGLSLRADPRTNSVVKIVLRTGLSLALALLSVGLCIQLATGADVAVNVRMFDLFAPRSAPERVLAVGALILTLTPAGGVVAVLLSWVRERDRRYVGVGVIVVAVLAAAIAVGLA